MSEKYLTDKKVLLNAPGMRVSSVYYSKANSSVDQAEVVWNYGRFSQTLTSLQLGAQSSLIFPRASIVRNVLMHFQLPAIVANQTIARGWGYNMISRISYILGSTTEVTILGQSHYQSVMESAATVEKRNELKRLGGEEYISPTVNPINAYVAIDLPFSSMGNGKKGIDQLMIDSPIQISIELQNANRLYGGIGVRPTALIRGRMMLVQGEFSYREHSLSNSLRQNLAYRYSYPYIHKQSAVLTKNCTAGSPTTITLNSFQNGDLLMISLGIVKTSDVQDGTNNSRNPFNYESVKDVTLLFNGTLMYNSPEQMYKLISMIDSDPSYVQNSIIAPGTTSPFSSAPIDTYILRFPFVPSNPLPFGEKTDGHFYNTWRIGSNTMTLGFTTEFTTEYTLYLTYYYNSIASINGNVVLYQD